MSGHVTGVVRIGARLAATTVMRGLAAGPDMFEGRSRYNSLSPRGGSVGLAVCRGGINSNTLEGACPVERKFLFENFVIGAFAKSLSGCGGCVVDPYPVSSDVFGSA